jgi:hypothetical protein
MNTSKLIKIKFIFLFVCLFIISACKETRTDLNTKTAEDAITMISVIDDVFNQIDAVAKNRNYNLSKTKNSNPSTCLNVITPSDNSTYPKTITLDYGASNCIGTDGKARRGKIIATISDVFYTQTTVTTVAFSNYYVNNNRIEGKYSIENLGRNMSENMTFAIKVKDFYIYTTAGAISFDGDITIEWSAGSNTVWPNVNDDEYLITGLGNGRSSGSENFSLTILSPLKYKLSCSWFTSGIMNVEPFGRIKRSIDFGNDVCDNSVKINIAGNISTITIN